MKPRLYSKYEKDKLSILEKFLRPKSVAVIGASRTPGAVGHEIVRNLIRSGYPGQIYPVNPKADKILDLKCYKKIGEVEDEVDLAIIAVPAKIVPQVAEEAGEKGVKCLIVVSAGFKEVGVEGAEREKHLLEICRKYGMRMLGPNCLGLINTSTPINASFAKQNPIKGDIAFFSQSGALCTAILDWAERENIGFSNLISLGNMTDTDETDFIELLANDKNTKAILIYIEGIKDGKRFLEVAPKVSKIKPIIVFKAGASAAGARAAASHTGSMAGSMVAYREAFRRSGVLTVDSLEDLFNLGLTLASQPTPEGRSIAILTNAGGPSIVAADAVSKRNLNLAWLSPTTIERLRSKLPVEASWINPVDVLGDALADRYAFALETLLKDYSVHAVIVILTPQAMTQPLETAKKIIEMRSKFPNKPILPVFMGGESVREAVELLARAGIPNFEYPERAADTLAGMIEYGEYLRSKRIQEIPKFKVRKSDVREIFDRVRRERRVNLLSVEAREVAKAYGIPVPEYGLAQDRRQAVEISRKIGYPVVMKVVSPQILHKTDIGGVKLNLKSDREVELAFNEIIRNASIFMPDARVFGVEIQKMVPQGREVIVGMHRDLQFGPLIMFGLGGIYVNLIKAVSLRLALISREEAYQMILETKAYALLRGIRGETSSDIDSVVDIILRISQLSMDFQEINEIDINPIFVYERGKGAIALDVKMTIGSE